MGLIAASGSLAGYAAPAARATSTVYSGIQDSPVSDELLLALEANLKHGILDGLTATASNFLAGTTVVIASRNTNYANEASRAMAFFNQAMALQTVYSLTHQNPITALAY